LVVDPALEQLLVGNTDLDSDVGRAVLTEPGVDERDVFGTAGLALWVCGCVGVCVDE
jgi:hypothetical protein